MKVFARIFVVAAVITALAGCTAIQIGGSITMREDGSGTRVIRMYVFDSDNGDGYGNAIRYLRLRGEPLRAKVLEHLSRGIGDTSWLTVTVHTGTQMNVNTNRNHTAEIVTITFNFTSFDDYSARMSQLAHFGSRTLPSDSEFRPPVMQATRTQFRFRESSNTALWAIRPLFHSMIADPQVFDFTAGGTNTNADLDQLIFFGLEMRGVPITLNFGANPPRTIISGQDVAETFRRN